MNLSNAIKRAAKDRCYAAHLFWWQRVRQLERGENADQDRLAYCRSKLEMVTQDSTA
jgi:hypothetical protein